MGEVVIAPVDSLAIGVKYDKRSGYLFVAGGFAGEGGNVMLNRPTEAAPRRLEPAMR